MPAPTRTLCAPRRVTGAPRPEENLSTPKKYKSKNIADIFDNKCIKYKSGSDEQLSVIEYLHSLRLHLRDMINELKASVFLKQKQKDHDWFGHNRNHRRNF